MKTKLPTAFNPGLKNKYARRIMLAISAALFNIAYFFPSVCTGFVFIGLICLFSIVLGYRNLGFWDGMTWGITFFLLHFIGIFQVVWEHGNGNFKMLCPLFLVLYFSLFAGVTFLGTSYCSSLVAHNTASYLLCWLIGLFFYFQLIHSYSLVIFGITRGYVFSLPLIPLATNSRWLYALGYCGSSISLFYILLVAACLARFLHCWTMRSGVICGIVLIPFFYVQWMSVPTAAAPNYIDDYAYAQPPDGEKTALDAAQKINSLVVGALQKKPRAKIIVMPESTYPYALTHDIVELWSKNALASGEKLIIGAHGIKEGFLSNCLFCIGNNPIIVDYVKTFPMIFTEYVPFPWNSISSAQNLFFKNKKKEFSITKKRGHILLWADEKNAFFPCICSELFFDAYPENRNSHVPWICLVNDRWFSVGYMRELMLLFARLYAVERRLELLYVSHFYGLGLGKYGEIWPL